MRTKKAPIVRFALFYFGLGRPPPVFCYHAAAAKSIFPNPLPCVFNLSRSVVPISGTNAGHRVLPCHNCYIRAYAVSIPAMLCVVLGSVMCCTRVCIFRHPYSPFVALGCCENSKYLEKYFQVLRNKFPSTWKFPRTRVLPRSQACELSAAGG